MVTGLIILFIAGAAIAVLLYFIEYGTFLSMNNAHPTGFASFQRFKEEYDKRDWKMQKHWTWIGPVLARRVDHNTELHASIICFDGVHMKLGPIALLRAVCYVWRQDIKNGVTSNPWKEK